MTMSLSIELEHESICVSDTRTSTIAGHLILTLDSSEELDFRHSSISLRLTGTEKVKANGDAIITLDETWRLSEYHLVHNYYAIIPFDLPLPRDLPISFLDSEGSIQYSLTAIFRSLPNNIELRSMQHPLSLIPPSLLSLSSSSSISSASLSSSFCVPFICPSQERSRLFWGTSEQAQWRYELELPQLINTIRPIVFNLRTQLRGFYPCKNPSPMESCMIGVQLIESIQMGSYSGTYRILMTTSRMLSQPSSTWSSPCAFSFELDQVPLSSTVCGTRIKITHHLQITLNYCSRHGETDRLVLDCNVPLIVPSMTTDQKIEFDWLHIKDTSPAFCMNP